MLIGGKNEIPIESIGMKRIRDGLEDLALLNALVDSGQGGEARELAETLVPRTYEAGEADAATYERFRSEAAELLAADAAQCASSAACAGGRDSSASEVISSVPRAASSSTSLASFGLRA